MRRIALLVCALAVLPWGGAVEAGGDTRIAVLLDGLKAREGVMVDGLVVVPLVAVEPEERIDVAPVPTNAGWDVVDPHRDLVDLIGGAVPAESRPALVLAGTLLTGGTRERLLAVTEPLAHDEKRDLRTIVCDMRDTDATPLVQRIGPLAPLEQRKLIALGESRESFATLLHIQRILSDAGDETTTLDGVLASEWLSAKAAETAAVLSRIPAAYAGRTRGHVAFLGHRPVEMVVFASGAEYRAAGPSHMQSLAVTHALWQRALGLEGRAWKPVAPKDYLAPAEHALKCLVDVRLRKTRNPSGAKSAWETSTGLAIGSTTVERFLVTVAGAPGKPLTTLSAIEDGPRTIHPLPLDGPGGRPVDEGPDIRGGGLTEDYLRRLLQRKAERNQR